jgi:aminotransferase
MSKFTGSKKATQFTESVIREMTRLNQMYGGVNLSQGFPDFPAPAFVKDAACAAIQADVNQYAVTWGARSLREAIAREFGGRYGVTVVPDEQVTVCCGATEAMMATMMAIIDPGDEVIIFEPFYENYGPDAILSGATPRYVTLGEPLTPGDTWTFDPDELAAAFNDRTKAIILNTPNNPTGKVFTREELQTIAALCRKWDVIAISDEIYEHIIYDEWSHVPIASLEGMADRTVTINSLSKTYSVTGWRVGWAISPPSLTGAIRKVHDFLTVGAAAPLQEAGVAALAVPDKYYADLAASYQRRRDLAGVQHAAGSDAQRDRFSRCQRRLGDKGRSFEEPRMAGCGRQHSIRRTADARVNASVRPKLVAGAFAAAVVRGRIVSSRERRGALFRIFSRSKREARESGRHHRRA